MYLIIAFNSSGYSFSQFSAKVGCQQHFWILSLKFEMKILKDKKPHYGNMNYTKLYFDISVKDLKVYLRY